LITFAYIKIFIENKVIHKFKNSTSFLLLLVFLLPSVVKFEHHHEHIECKAKNEKHYHVLHDKCVICDFEFSIFIADIWDIDFQKEKPLGYFSNHYDPAYFPNLSQYSFLLRAPPLFTMSI